jgi:hypothetical protein
VRELFDFCATGVTEPNYGPNFKARKYPKGARCRKEDPDTSWDTWSASLESAAPTPRNLSDMVLGKGNIKQNFWREIGAIWPTDRVDVGVER